MKSGVRGRSRAPDARAKGRGYRRALKGHREGQLKREKGSGGAATSLFPPRSLVPRTRTIERIACGDGRARRGGGESAATSRSAAGRARGKEGTGVRRGDHPAGSRLPQGARGEK